MYLRLSFSSFSLLRDQTHLSPVQEAPLLWQPHTCEGRAGVMHTHTQTDSALWSAHSIIDQPWGCCTCQWAAGTLCSLLHSPPFLFSGVLVCCRGRAWLPTSELIRSAAILVCWNCGNLTFMKVGWLSFSRRQNCSHWLVSTLGWSQNQHLQWLEFCKMENTVNESFLLIHCVFTHSNS